MKALLQNNEGRKLSWYGDVNPTDSSNSDTMRYGIERNHQNFLKIFSAIKLGVILKQEVQSLSLQSITSYELKILILIIVTILHLYSMEVLLLNCMIRDKDQVEIIGLVVLDTKIS